MGKKFFILLLGLLSCVSLAFAQTPSRVTGTVTLDEDGSPAIGASVMVKGTSIGVVTDVNGRFVLEGIPASATTLEISSIGMVSVEVPISSVVNVSLQSDNELLEEAVVTIAYGAAKRSSLTGAISSVDSEKIVNRPTSAVTSALEGTVAGVQVNSTYGSPGDDPSIRIRGIGTVNGSSSPLYVLDGVPFGGNISDLNPADIESISVLKDAASAALYGNRASNGVILITTKKGSGTIGRVNVTLDIKQGTYSRGLPEYERANDREFMEIYWMELRNSRMSAGDDAATAAAYATENLIADKLYLNIYNQADNALFTSDGKLNPSAVIKNGYKEDLDWFDYGIRDGYRQEYNLSASAASDKSDYYFSVGYLDENGYVSNNGFDRLSGRASVNVRPVTWFKAGLNLNASHQNYENTNGGSSNSYTNVFMYARQIAPIYPVHLHDIVTGEYILDGNGQKQYDGGSYTDANGVVQITRNQYQDRHVYWENELNKDNSIRNVVNAIAYADLYFLKDFTFTVTGNLGIRNSSNQTYNSAVIGDGKGNNGRGSREDYRYKNYTFQQQLKWNHQFGSHSVNVLAGHENYYYHYDYLYGYKTNEVFPNGNYLRNFTEITNFYTYGNVYTTESYLGRVRYNFMDRYNLEASFRRDGSSRFSKKARWGNFWSIGANWMISNEPFMQTVSWVNSLKLRADYGEVGNDSGTGYYGYQALYSSTQNANKGAYWLSQLPNEDLKWETGQSWGVGIESRLFNRLNFNIEYFDKRNKDLIFDVYQPLSAGATSTSSAVSVTTQNIGVISNRGVEVEANLDLVHTRDFRVNVNANATFLRNKVVTLPEQNKDGIIDGSQKIVEGKDRYAWYTWTWEGVDLLTGNSLYKFNNEDYYITEDNTADGNVLWGSATDEEGNANTLMSADNYVVIGGTPYVYNTAYGLREWHGSAMPKVYGSFGTDISYKNLTLSALFTYQLGSKIMDGVYSSLMSVGGTPSAQHRDLLGSWMAAPSGVTENSSAADRISKDALPQINNTVNTYNNATCDRWLTSGNYLVLKNLAVSYQLPKAWAGAAGLQGISLTAACENVFTKTARRGMNPQQGFSGYQSNYLVTPRVFTMALNIRF